MMTLQSEYTYFKNHLDELASIYNGKWVVIKNQQVVGVYDDAVDAIRKTSEEHELGTFLVQHCERNPEAFTQTFHSRVLTAF